MIFTWLHDPHRFSGASRRSTSQKALMKWISGEAVAFGSAATAKFPAIIAQGARNIITLKPIIPREDVETPASLYSCINMPQSNTLE